MTIEDIILLRLHNQQISHNPSNSPEEVVACVGAMQAQDYAGAKWSLGLRLPRGTEADIDEAIARKAIVRTWPMRGTLHFVAADDVRWMLKLLTPRIISGSAGRNRQLELDDAIFNKSQDLLIAAMEGGKQLMRSEVYAILENAGITTAGQRGIHIINYLAQKQVICHGVHNEKQPTYALLDEWIPVSKILEGKEALAELALRYFKSHGPATLNDFVWWSGLKISDAKEGLNSVMSMLEQIEVEGKIYWIETGRYETNAIPSTFLLPGFDEYMLGYTDRTLTLAAQHAPKIVPGNNGMFMPTIVVDGKVKGLWKRVLKKDKILIEIFPFEKFTKAKIKSITSEAKKYGNYLGKNVSLAD
ncbi:winged helix DNA-binding domain-containing protein [Dyadobacter psychrophilus]|uniref:Winged helix DNA-binding domain-containing protein n=1 Tax=Dyadobacter psychrophilus TaxID=651661 RepID=A0A1T5FMQ6_9BACT|nr:winged helix DNA-binding domain-containing protein [Dyadobacter psychrophilus]SKB97461.1 Winged helix DNA-binding domain-containing protein [Dyadobacter psychrophilus]